MVRIVGCCHPKARNNDYVGPQLTWDRMRESWHQLKGRPILDNHDVARKVGQVMDAWVDAERQLWIMAEIDENSPMGQQVAQRIRSGEYRGLSLGMDHGVMQRMTGGGGNSNECTSRGSDRHATEEGWEGVERVCWSTITEVSVCEKGKYPNTVLHSHFSQNPAVGDHGESSGVLLSVTAPGGSETCETGKKIIESDGTLPSSFSYWTASTSSTSVTDDWWSNLASSPNRKIISAGTAATPILNQKSTDSRPVLNQTPGTRFRQTTTTTTPSFNDRQSQEMNTSGSSAAAAASTTTAGAGGAPASGLGSTAGLPTTATIASTPAGLNATYQTAGTTTIVPGYGNVSNNNNNGGNPQGPPDPVPRTPDGRFAPYKGSVGSPGARDRVFFFVFLCTLFVLTLCVL